MQYNGVWVLLVFFLQAVLKLTKDKMPLVVEDCYNSLVNLSSEDHANNFILSEYNIIPEFFNVMCDPTSKYSDKVCMIVSNLTRTLPGSQKVAEHISELNPNANDTENRPSLDKLLDLFCKASSKKVNANLDYVATIFSNITQLREGAIR